MPGNGTVREEARERGIGGLAFQSPFTVRTQWPNSCRLIHDIFTAAVVHEIMDFTSTQNMETCYLNGPALTVSNTVAAGVL